VTRTPASTPPPLLLALAGAGLFVAALDAYAVVTLLPQMMTSAGLPVDQIQSATPIVSGFLGGYVVAMPLLGAYSDARGRLPVYAAALALFGLGSALTASSSTLGQLVAGRALQGLGGGALVPLSLALAADLYREESRGLAVGGLSALQEAGSVVGPLYGAGVAAALGGWHGVFWLNLPIAGAIVLGLWLASPGRRLRLAPPARDQVDWGGAVLLGAGLALAMLALYPDDPQRSPVNSHAVPLALGAGVALAGFGWRQARRLTPLIDPSLLRRPGFGGSLGANLLIGVALMVALVDVPLVGRGVFDLDALHSALLLTRFLAGVPVGALLGGWLVGRVGRQAVAAAGLIVSGGAFALMSTWGVDELSRAGAAATVELFGCGLGFGLVIAPLSVTALDLGGRQYGLASSLVVLSRTVGMAVGLAALTAFGLARFQRIFAAQGCMLRASESLKAELSAYEACVRTALLLEYREIFWVAAGLAGLAALVVLITLPARRPGGIVDRS
jgi:MFS family permease